MSTTSVTSSSGVDVVIPTSRNPASLTLMNMLAMNAVVCGLEFCASAAFCYIPPLLLKAGIAEQNMTIVLAVGPSLGFFLVPLIGRSSDRCRSRFGRRRPYILGLSLALLTALLVLAYGRRFITVLFGKGVLGTTAAMVLLIGGCIALDFSCQACLTPCEALLSDASKETGQHDRCFTIYSLAVSVGGCVGYLITALDWQGSAMGKYLGGQERTVFILLAAFYLITLFITFGNVEETPLSLSQLPDDTDVVIPLLSNSNTSITGDPEYAADEVTTLSDISPSRKPKQEIPNGIHKAEIPMGILWSFFILLNSLLKSFTGFLYRLLPKRFQVLFDVPAVLRRLALANFCSWTALMAFNLFYTDFVGQAVYNGDPHAAENSLARERYDKGVRAGSWGLLFHCISSSLYATLIESLAARIGLRNVYLLGMVSLSVTMTSMLMTKNIYIVNILATCTGITYATMTTVPFMLVTEYHSNREIYYSDTAVGGVVPLRGFGTDLSTLDSAYFLSQVVLTSFMGSIVHYTHTVGSYIMCAGLAGAIACFFILRIVGNKTHMQLLKKSSGL